VRRLKPGKTYDDFVDAWYPNKGSGYPDETVSRVGPAPER
jgi:hypothetical protein